MIALESFLSAWTAKRIYPDDIDAPYTRLRSPPAQRQTRRRSDLRCAAIRWLWYGEPNAISNAIGYALHRSRSHDAVIRVYDDAGNAIETHEHKGDFKEW